MAWNCSMWMQLHHHPTVIASKPHFNMVPKIVNGGIAGVVACLCVFPLDLVKTRIQNQQPGPQGEKMYKSVVDCFRQTLRYEGFLGLYRGLAVSLVFVAPEKALKLAVNDFFRFRLTASDGTLTMVNQMLSGAITGVSQLIITTPMELLKIQLQDAGRIGSNQKAEMKQAAAVSGEEAAEIQKTENAKFQAGKTEDVNATTSKTGGKSYAQPIAKNLTVPCDKSGNVTKAGFEQKTLVSKDRNIAEVQAELESPSAPFPKSSKNADIRSPCLSVSKTVNIAEHNVIKEASKVSPESFTEIPGTFDHPKEGVTFGSGKDDARPWDRRTLSTKRENMSNSKGNIPKTERYKAERIVPSTKIGTAACASTEIKPTARLSASTIALSIFREKGILGIYRGLTATALRDVTFNMIYFPAFATLNALGPIRIGHEKDQQHTFSWTFLSGFSCACVAAILVTPFDVVKTRLQLISKKPGEYEYSGVMDAFKSIYAREGARAFMKGALVRAIVLAPLFGIAQVFYFLGIAERFLPASLQGQDEG